MTVTKAGLIINEHYPYLAASPDGWIECSCCSKNVLKIKCPFSIRDMQPDAAPYLMKQPDGSIVLDRGHEYFYQVQGQINLCNADCCYFIVWQRHDINSLIRSR